MPSQVKHLTAMLFTKGVSKKDASALRYALHVLENSTYRPKAIAHKDVPYWRLVNKGRHTVEYQCLNCMKNWESIIPPGKLEWSEELDRNRYTQNWNYCPHCNIEWHGPQDT